MEHQRIADTFREEYAAVLRGGEERMRGRDCISLEDLRVLKPALDGLRSMRDRGELPADVSLPPNLDDVCERATIEYTVMTAAVWKNTAKILIGLRGGLSTQHYQRIRDELIAAKKLEEKIIGSLTPTDSQQRAMGLLRDLIEAYTDGALSPSPPPK